jgi:hypothetical protein
MFATLRTALFKMHAAGSAPEDVGTQAASRNARRACAVRSRYLRRE